MVRPELDADDSKVRAKERDRDDERDRDNERSKEKLREKDRDRDKEKARDRHKEKERPKDRDKDRARDRDGDKDRDRERGKDRGYDRERDYDRDRDRDYERDRDRDYERARERDHDRDRDHRERDYDRDKERDRDRDRIREGSKDLEKENERDRNKDKDEKFRDGAKHKDREKDDKKRDRARDADKIREEDNRRDTDLFKERKKEKDKRDRDMENDGDKDREREREKERGREKDRERTRGKEREKEKLIVETMERGKYKDVGGKEKEKDQQSEKQKDQDKIVDMELEPLEAGEIDVQERPHFQVPKKGANEISAWVNKSRILEEKKKTEERNKAEWMAKFLSDQDDAGDSDNEENQRYSAKDLAGLKVLHGIDKVMEGGAVVLTLKDKNILEGDDVNEDVDELENIEIAQQRARDEAYKAAKKKPGTYEDKFQNDINAVRTILPHYDEVMQDQGMELDDSGGLNEEGLRKLEELKKKLQGNVEKPSVALPTLASEYLSQEEMLQFIKPKKKKKLRKKTGLDLNALEAEAKAEGLDNTDHGSRMADERKAARLEKEKTEEELRRSAYLNAYAKAVDASLKLKVGNISETRGDDSVVFGGEEDDELERFLQRSRQAALKKQAENGGLSVGPQAVVTTLQQSTVEDMETLHAEENAEKDKGTVVISDMEEFCRSLQLDEILMRRPAAKDAFGEDDEPAVEEKASPVDGAWTDNDQVQEDEDMEEQNGEGENQKEEVISEVSIGKGLAGALQLLKERGTLKETVDWGGRDMDKKKSKLVGIVDKEEKFRNREIILDRVDEFGRTMTPKEAFRKLSHKFHGKGPGKMKQEKKMKQHEKEQKLKQMSAGDTPSLSMEKMREVQAKMHTPYIVISGHIKPGQTSDPRSGFATVEKESVGSLTPMLGDKKVEHFLGIKRKPEDGSMKPPLPKKTKQ